CWISTIQVGLFGIKEVVIPLPSFSVEFPCRSAESGKPIVARPIRSLPIAPHVPLAILGGTRGFGIEEPFVLVRSMVHHEIHDDANVPAFTSTGHSVEIR